MFPRMRNCDQNSPKIYAAVLAAGESRRFGAMKQTALLGEVPLVRRAVSLANRSFGDRTLLVVGHDPEAVLASAERPDGFVAVNERYRDGIGTSIATATASLRHVADAIVLVFADQPLLTPQHLQALCAEWSGRDKHIVATAFYDDTGPPVLLPRGAFDFLSTLSEDRGAKSLFSDPAFEVTTIRFDDAAFDVDRPEDIERIEQRPT